MITQQTQRMQMTSSRIQKAGCNVKGHAYTLIEVLIVLFIMVLLAGVALPTVKDMLADQRTAKTARNITAYLDAIRNRAISEGQRAGVRIERLSAIDPIGRAQSVRIKELVSIPPYTGDASNSFMTLTKPDPNFPSVCVASFNPHDNALLKLSSQMVAGPPQLPNDLRPPASAPDDDPLAPIRSGDYLELPGGRLVAFKILPDDGDENSNAQVMFDLGGYETLNGPETFPSSILTESRRMRYKIHRRPIPSSSAPYSLPRGVVFDLNYSGLGAEGNHFAPTLVPTGSAEGAKPIDIIFGPDGRVESITTAYSDSAISPSGKIFLCLGDSDGIRPDSLLTDEKKAPANILNVESKWIVINPSIGRVFSSPFATVTMQGPIQLTDPYDPQSNAVAPNPLLAPILRATRILANEYSDTVDLE